MLGVGLVLGVTLGVPEAVGVSDGVTLLEGVADAITGNWHPGSRGATLGRGVLDTPAGPPPIVKFHRSVNVPF